MRTVVARGIFLASSLLASGSAIAQGPVYGTPSLLPPSNTGAGAAASSGARSLPPVRSSAVPAQQAAFRRQNSQPDNQGQSSILAEPVPQGTPSPSNALPPGGAKPHNYESPSDLPSTNYGAPPAVYGSGVENYGGAPSSASGGGYSGGYSGAPNDAGGYSGSCIGSGAGDGGVSSSGYPASSVIGGGGGCGPGYAGGSVGYGSGFGGYPGGAVAGAGSGWYAGAGGLIMTRDKENHYLFSYDTANEARQLLDTRDASMNWAGGFEAWVGKYYNCGMSAVEVGYWGLFPGSTSATVTAADVAGSLNGIQNWNSITYGPNLGDQYVNNAQAHRITRDFQFNNLELNFLSFSNCCGGGYSGNPNLQWNWLAGVRYFRFQEFLEFASDPLDTVFNGQIDELYYRIRTENNLVGFQLGGNGRYCVTQKFALTSGLKFGIYNNHISAHQWIGGTGGTAFINNGPFTGQNWDIAGTKNDIAFLGELNVGFNYQWNCRWSTYAGYRAVAISGVALPTNQIYPDLRGINDLRTIESNGSLVLHGAYAGLTFCF